MVANTYPDNCHESHGDSYQEEEQCSQYNMQVASPGY